MAKIRVIGKVVTDIVAGTVGQNNTKFIKYLVEVSIISGQSNNPRVAQENVKKSYFAVMAFGKQADFPITKGITIEVEGGIEISKFQLDLNNPAKDALIITPENTTILQGNIVHFAKVYNTLGNLVKDDAEVYISQNGGKHVYSQKIAIGKKVGDQEYTSFYGVKLFGDRGEKLFSRQMLNKTKVKSILVDGTITATYTKKDTNEGPKEYFNVDINVNDFQIGSWASKEHSNQNTSTNDVGSYKTYNEPPVEYYDGYEEINEDEIPF